MHDPSNDHFAVVTGASQGLGMAFARTLAENRTNLILASLPQQGLAKLAEELSRRFRIKVFYYETDFASDQGIQNFTKWVNENFKVHILINNAGTGGTQRFDQVSIDYLNTIIQVNVKATAFLTHQLLPNLKQREKAHILNVSSMAAFSPIGYKTVYPASKSFIQSFSLGLAEELKETGVSVSVVNPGAMRTNAEITARIERQGLLGKFSSMEPEKVARYSLKKMFRGDVFILLNPLSWLSSRLLPLGIKVPMLTRVIKRELSYE